MMYGRYYGILMKLRDDFRCCVLCGCQIGYCVLQHQPSRSTETQHGNMLPRLFVNRLTWHYAFHAEKPVEKVVENMGDVRYKEVAMGSSSVGTECDGNSCCESPIPHGINYFSGICKRFSQREGSECEAWGLRTRERRRWISIPEDCRYMSGEALNA